MPVFHVSLPSVSAVKDFVSAATKIPCDIDVRAGRYLVNGKSIMGLFSIDLAKPVQVDVHGTEEQTAELKRALSDQLTD